MNKKIIALIGVFILGGLLLPRIHLTFTDPAVVAQTNVSHASPEKQTAPVIDLPPEEVYARAAQRLSKSVVNIDTTEQLLRRGGFFEEDQNVERKNQGSGVIIEKSGYILTNEHVVGKSHQSGKDIMVTLQDGRKISGTIVGADQTTDLALVKIDGNDFPAAEIGNPKILVPGQGAVAIGNPFGLKFTVTHGVISALGRPISMEGRIYPDLIQHDAFINPGNSGGALVNLKGQLIGINTLVDQRAQGIGFAIPIDTALRVSDELKKFG
ncbi:MAG: trypsin-like peptidase domain-containing protein, partial [Chthonomonadales bacterium]